VENDAFKVVLLTRLSPLFPYNVLNYAYGLTNVPLRTYTLASWIGMLPGTLMYAYLGSAARDLALLLAGQIDRSPAQHAMFVVGLVATTMVTLMVARSARRALTGVVDPR
jgi:uncharacterized membrane protein YdjX (TVP38/TMEM64 family)